MLEFYLLKFLVVLLNLEGMRFLRVLRCKDSLLSLEKKKVVNLHSFEARLIVKFDGLKGREIESRCWSEKLNYYKISLHLYRYLFS